MNITRFAIEKNRITYAFLFIIILGGYTAYNTISRAMESSFVIRWALITTDFPGASPERMEMLISDPIEKVVQETPELDYVQSTSVIGYSSVFVRLKDQYTDTQPIWDDLERRLDDLRPTLPGGIKGPDLTYDFDETYGIQIALIGEGYSYAELNEIAKELRDEILQVPDVALNLSFPLFDGGSKYAEKRKVSEELKQLQIQYEAAAEKIEQRIRSSLYLVGASFAAIRELTLSAEAAAKSLNVVQDAYAQGAVSILDLLDAQNVALVSQELAENAVFDFTIDMMSVERAVGRFYLQLNEEEAREYLQRLEAYYVERGFKEKN